MRYLSVCSGIEAATVAWHPLGWMPVAFSEIEPFPSAVLAHHYPTVPNLGDMTNHAAWPLQHGDIDLLVGGTPCQSFSVAGLRKGLSDPRGGLMLTYLEIARRLRPRWIVWENVPGVLSSGRGRDFGSFLGALGELGYGWAYRVLDAQWVRTQQHPRAVPQRRRRVFVVGCLGDAARAAQVLLERQSVERNPAPRGKARKGAAADAEGGVGAVCGTLDTECGGGKLSHQSAVNGHLVASSWWDGGDCAATLTKQNANGAQRMPDKDNFGAVLQPVVGSLCANDAKQIQQQMVNQQKFIVETQCFVPVQPVCIDRSAFNQGQNAKWDCPIEQSDTMFGLIARGPHAVVFPIDGRNAMRDPEKHDEVNRQGVGVGNAGEPSHTVTSAAVHAVAFTCKDYGADASEVAPTLRAMPHDGSHANGGGQFAVAVLGDHTHTLTHEGHDASEDGTGRGTPVVAFNWQNGGGYGNANIGDGSVSPTLCKPSGSDVHAVAHGFYSTGGTHGVNMEPEVSPAVKVGSGLGIPSPPAVATQMVVRRLTPVECERLQGFPDNYTNIPWRGKPESPDGPRYKALGNSMAVNCMEWIGERIAAYEARSKA